MFVFVYGLFALISAGLELKKKPHDCACGLFFLWKDFTFIRGHKRA